MAAVKPLTEAQIIGAIGNPAGYRMFLICGPEETAAHTIASNLCKKMGDMERIDIDSDMLKSEPALLADEACSQSLFGDKRYIRLSLKRDEALGAIENLLECDNAENIVIATAGNLTKASKLRKLAEKSAQIAFHICYAPDAKDLVPILIDNARSKGLQLDRALSALIAQNCNYNRSLAFSEIEKLALYYDADSERPVEAKIEDFVKLSADAAADNQGALINALLCGNIKQSGEQLSEAREMGLNAISVVRAMQRRITMLAAMRPQVDGGRSAAEVVKRNPAIFWKEESLVAIQLTIWTSQRLAALITHLLNMEGEIMAVKVEFSTIFLEQELMRIARAAASVRRKHNIYS